MAVLPLCCFEICLKVCLISVEENERHFRDRKAAENMGSMEHDSSFNRTGQKTTDENQNSPSLPSAVSCFCFDENEERERKIDQFKHHIWPSITFELILKYFANFTVKNLKQKSLQKYLVSYILYDIVSYIIVSSYIDIFSGMCFVCWEAHLIVYSDSSSSTQSYRQ